MEKRDGFLIHDRFEAYGESSPYIDWEDPWIIRVDKSLTAAYLLPINRWVSLDARGNKLGIQARIP